MINYHLLPQFRPARLQDLVLWYEPWSFRGRTWRNLAPNFSDRNHGTAYGGVGLSTWHPQFAPALEFHAEDDYVDLPLDVVFDDEMSIEIVFELYDYTDNGRILGSIHNSGSYYQMRHYIASNLKLFFYVGNGSSIYNVYFYLGDWYAKTHGVWTWEYDEGNDETTLKGYKNGKHEYSRTFSGKVQLPDVNLRLGHWGNIGMKGKIYLARFYHKVLSEDEIRHNYTHHPLYFLQRGIDPYMFVKKGGIYYVM